MIPFLFATTFKIMSDRFRMHKKLLQIQQEKKSTELSYLQSQINPHFLFNVLNTIYFQISKQNTKGRNLVDLVSQVLRYQLYETKAERIEIEKELEYTRNYVEILKYCNKNLKMEVYVDKYLTGFRLAPLLLRSLIEACIRDDGGEHENTTSFIHIKFSRTGDFQFLTVVEEHYTTVADQMLISDKNSGLLNLRRQLEILYPESYILRRVDDAEAGIKTTTLVLDYGKN